LAIIVCQRAKAMMMDFVFQFRPFAVRYFKDVLQTRNQTVGGLEQGRYLDSQFTCIGRSNKLPRFFNVYQLNVNGHLVHWAAKETSRKLKVRRAQRNMGVSILAQLMARQFQGRYPLL